MNVFLEFGDALLHNTAVDFDLGLTHAAAGAHAAPLALQVRPHARQAGEHVVVVRQFHLHLGVRGLSPLGEDFQDEAGTVDDIAAGDDLFYIPLLHAGEFVVEDDVLDLVLHAVFLDFFQFARADVGGLVRPVHALGEHFVREGAGGGGQEGQFVQVLLHFALAALFQDDAHKDSLIGFEFAHRLQRYEKRDARSSRA